MTITVDHEYFTDEQTALDEIERLKLWRHDVEAPPSGGTPLHWHDVGIYAYITSGTFRFQDPATEMVHECTAGTRFVIPERALHIEEEHNGYNAFVGFTKENVPEPFVRDPAELEEPATV